MNSTKQIAFRVTPADFNALKKRADKAGQTVSDYCRARMFEFNGEQIPALQMPDGQIIPVGQLQEGSLVFVGPEYNEEAVAKGA